jgi:hypothetical protein
MPVQGGQLLIDRIRAWKLVHLSNYMCQHSDYYFKHMYGDQDTWRVSLSALATVPLPLSRESRLAVSSFRVFARANPVHCPSLPVKAIRSETHTQRGVINTLTPTTIYPVSVRFDPFRYYVLNTSRTYPHMSVFKEIYQRRAMGREIRFGDRVAQIRS